VFGTNNTQEKRQMMLKQVVEQRLRRYQERMLDMYPSDRPDELLERARNMAYGDVWLEAPPQTKHTLH